MIKPDDLFNDYTKNVEDGIYPESPSVPLPAPYTDERGKIQNLLLRPCTSVAIIESKAKTIRANHTHSTDWHYAYVIKGCIRYYEREPGSKEIPTPETYHAGSMFFTPPQKEHAMVFDEDTVFITMAKNVRSHESHESDLKRVDFITPEIAWNY